jgi:hypothetical protein
VEIGSVTGGKGVGKADISFAADQGRNAQPKSAEILPTKKMALAVYYPWYRDRDVFSSNVLDKVLSDRNALRNAVDGYWTKNLAFKDRPLGPDDMNGKGMVSYDPVALRKQVEQAIDAGMDGFLPYYRGITHFTHGASGLLLDAAKEVSDARKVEFRIGHHISPQGAQENVASGQDPVDLLVDWTTDWVGKYGNHPAFMKMKGKPLAIVYSTGLLQPADWAAYRSKLKSKGIELFLVLDNASSNSFEQYIVHFDGAIGRTIDAARGLAIGKQLRYNAVFSTEAPKLWLGEAKPGFDSSDRGAAKDAKYIDRANGAYLNQTFDAAVAINPQWLRIVSWDEYYEHTHVEPSLMYGTTYYDIARTRIAGWKSSP